MADPNIYTYDMRARHESCPRCGVWHSSMNCADEYLPKNEHRSYADYTDTYRIPEEMTTKKERNLLYAEMDNLNDQIIKFETHSRYLMNILLRLRVDFNGMIRDIDDLILNRDTLVKLTQTWFEGLEALSTCTDDMQKTLESEIKISKMLAIDTEFLKKTYEIFGDPSDGQSET